MNNILNKNFNRTKIIAEISANHCGSKQKFLEHIIQAKKFGADFVKIQTYEPIDMVVNKKFKIEKGLWKGKTLWNLYENACTPFKWHFDAFKIARKNKITLFSTPFSERALKFLKQFKPQLYKIASFELTDHCLIDNVAKNYKPIILSTGLSDIKEVKSAIKVIRKYHNKIILLYCVSGYPTPLENIDFKRIDKLKKSTGVKLVGFSDHTLGITASIDAINKKVPFIERHFTINKSSSSPDVKFSISCEELKILKNYALNRNKLEIKTKSNTAEKINKIFRRSIYVVKNIKKGEKFTSSNIKCFRPCIGLGAEQYFKVLGKKAKSNIKKNKVLNKNLVKEL